MSGLTIPLADQVYDEDAICALLHVNREQLAELRSKKSLPTIYLNTRKRVYLAEDILNWLQSLRRDR